MSEKEVIENETGAGNDAAASGDPSATAEALSEQQIAELKEQAAKAKQHYEQLLRVTADLENYKKRAARERQEAIKFANESLLEKIIPILDNFEMALAAASAPNTSVPSLQAGVNMIHQQLKTAIANAGLEEIDATGKTFDPNLHEAISQQETAEAPEGQVVQQMRKGYKLRDRLLRPASVVVAKKPAGKE
jgi:molecular chaperone GrpE